MKITNYDYEITSNCFYEENSHTFLKNSAINTKGERFISFDLKWTKIKDAKSYALVLIDYEASRVIGQAFVHWIVANIKQNYLELGANINNKNIIQGLNSTVEGASDNRKGTIIECVPGGFKNNADKAADFFPPMPPDDRHLYTVKIYALDIEKINLENGYHLSELYEEMHNHIITEFETHFWFNPEGDK
ncbi:Phospholipid-binding protein [Mycoplasmopsis meleagridis]|uniref:Phospholipid-binding protein n=1 Tax=Mycoplasmopsis meleagridis ATCC 25294 TaxID=1264554 RepID=A0A0F5H2B2_9BACT|nr:YbhB/YbcL family Raf kinase inhibitor-like protein [Mycoplasmopsis meleagridis]KKB26977.1 Phospholipid-binding protein [Mycoplasmopsis meleagridis ATCC 25294]OAD18566.1 Phospholipid-binding protein [Mycoplasmopsis meleagridis]VEU77565.1 Phospholipid-binding protein [Mycoplasmopsis meleagridis]